MPNAGLLQSPREWKVNNTGLTAISAPCSKREGKDESRRSPGFRKLLYLRALGTRHENNVSKIKWEQVAGKRRQLNVVAVAMSWMLGKQAVAEIMQSINEMVDKYSSSP